MIEEPVRLSEVSLRHEVSLKLAVCENVEGMSLYEPAHEMMALIT